MMQRALGIMPGGEDLVAALQPKRMAQPDEIGDYAVFLCSPSGSYINGTGLIVDGGLTLGGIHMG